MLQPGLKSRQDNLLKIIANESMARHKHGIPTSSKDKNPPKRKGGNNQNGIIQKENEEIDITDHKTPKEV
jgi:hypothetical protein